MGVLNTTGSGTEYRLSGGGEVTLGPVLARAGEGTLYTVAGQSNTVAKIFHPTLSELDKKLRKVTAMVTSQPSGAIQDDGFTVLTWPTHVLSDRQGPVGYLMPRIDTTNAVEIHALSNPAHRAKPLPDAPQWTAHASWSHLLTVASNLCLAVDVVHRVDAVIGDFQERNILVADTCQVTLVDCDSMQFTDHSGHDFLCAVGRPEFTAPELIGRNLSTDPRGRESDLFALAIHIHLLLMGGNHPFQRGIWTGAGEQPSAIQLAASGDWAGGRNSRLQTHPLAPPITFLPKIIQGLFAHAFTRGATNPAARPTAAQWRSALLTIRLTDCPRSLHQIPVDANTCPWCAIDAERVRRRNTSPTERQIVNQVMSPTKTGQKRAIPVRAHRTKTVVATSQGVKRTTAPTVQTSPSVKSVAAIDTPSPTTPRAALGNRRLATSATADSKRTAFPVILMTLLLTISVGVIAGAIALVMWAAFDTGQPASVPEPTSELNITTPMPRPVP